jgi:hypothetical protein
MGGGGSRPAPAPTVVEEPPPAGSGQSSIIYPNRAGTPRLDGLTRSMANECNNCILRVTSGTTSSSVKLSREFGEVTDMQCQRYKDDRKRVTDKKMSFQDFLGNLKAGRYMKDLSNGHCEQITVNEENEKKMTKIEDVTDDKLQSVRIQKVSSGGFSSDTKIKLTPSIPFKLTFQGQEIEVKTMTVYHPCPLRIEGVQPDAVFSLNDPSFEDGNGYVILIPLAAKNTADPSIGFFDKILPQISALKVPEATGQYMTHNVPTGTDWSLAKVFSANAGNGESFEVKNGYYEWKGMPALERVKSDIYNAWTNQSTITYSWKESGKPAPRYIMLDTPVAISGSSLSSITQTLPVTPSTDGIHAVLYNSDPFQRGIVHKLGPPNCSTMTRETFADMNGVKEEFCDSWTTWAQDTKPQGYTTQQIFALIFNVLVFIAMGVGAYLALAAVLRLYDIELKNVSAGLGKITAVVFKSLRQKAGEMKGMGSGFGGLGGLLALSKGKVPPQMLQQANQNTGIPDVKSITPEQIAKIQQANPDAKAAADKAAKEAAEKVAKEAAEKVAAEKVAAEKVAAEKVAAEKAAADAQTAKDKAAAEKVAADKAAKEAADKKKRDEQLAQVASDTKQRNEANAAKAAAEAKAAKDKADADAKAAAQAAKDKADADAKAAAEAKAAKDKADAEAAAKLNEARAKSAEVPKPIPVTPPKGKKWEYKDDYLTQRGLKKNNKGGKPKRGRGRVGSTRRAGY